MPGKCTNINHRGAVSAITFFSLFLAVFLSLISFIQPAIAAVTWSGDVIPDVPTSWTSSTRVHVGYSSSGTLNITDGGTVNDATCFIGNTPGSTGEVTVDGLDSTWTNRNSIFVGYGGNGILNISDSGFVTAGTWICISHEEGSSGTINFDNGSLTTTSLTCAFNDLTGTGTIDTHGLVSDVDLVFDATNGFSQTLLIDDNPEQNITVNLNIDGTGAMGAGYSGVGNMSISDGRVLESYNGYIGYKIGSTGVVTVNGAGSMWASKRNPYMGDTPLYVGLSGSGMLNIEDGGEVSNSDGIIGHHFGSMGKVTVDGIGSMWTNSDQLVVGNEGEAVLNITNGGLVSVSGIPSIDSNSSGDAFINIYSGGMLALFGDVDDSLADFLELVDGTDAIRYWNNSNSSWANITEAILSDDYTLSYQTEGDLAGYTILTVTSTMAGDADGDGAVDVADLGILATNYNQGDGFTWEQADFTGNGIVDVSDLGILATAYGNSCFETTSQSVPEPTIITLLMMGAIGLLAYSRRTRK